MGHKELNHPLVGSLALRATTLLVADDPNLKVFVYTPLPQADTAQKLAWLAGPTHTNTQVKPKKARSSITATATRTDLPLPR